MLLLSLCYESEQFMTVSYNRIIQIVVTLYIKIV